MSVRTKGWMFIGFILLVPIVYALHLGIFIGYQAHYVPSNSPFYSGYCRYLYLSGIRDVWANTTGATAEEAKRLLFCPLFGN